MTTRPLTPARRWWGQFCHVMALLRHNGWRWLIVMRGQEVRALGAMPDDYTPPEPANER